MGLTEERVIDLIGKVERLIGTMEADRAHILAAIDERKEYSERTRSLLHAHEEQDRQSMAEHVSKSDAHGTPIERWGVAGLSVAAMLAVAWAKITHVFAGRGAP